MLPLPLLARGKVRELYAVGDDQVLVVASDRVSAYDVVLPTPVPDKGAVLTAMTLFWLARLDVPHHLLTARVSDYPAELRAHEAALHGRSMLCRRLAMVPLECVVRGWLTGSGYADYAATGAVAGHPLPPGLRDGDRLPAPLFTPSTKAAVGEHDVTVSEEQAAEELGADLVARLKDVSLRVFGAAAALAEERGLLLADTKLELGHDADGVLRLGDEVLTPDSSRFWPADAPREPGTPPPSLDKQVLRDWLTAHGHRGAAVPLPDDVVALTRDRYLEALTRLTGSTLDAHLEATA